jgi:hypothetical protein
MNAMKTLNIKNAHFDFEYVDLELNNGEDNILVNLYNSDNLHPNLLIENQMGNIIRQIDTFYKKKKGELKKEFEILIDIVLNGRPSYMMGFVRIQ